MKAAISLILACAMFTGCATAYNGPKPDSTKRGRAALEEYDKFRISDSYGGLNLYSAEMGNKEYYLDTVDPIITEASPSWPSRHQTMKIASYTGWGFLALAIGSIFVTPEWQNKAGYWIGLGGIIGSGIYLNVTGMHAAEQYNNDLKSKLSPSIALSKSF